MRVPTGTSSGVSRAVAQTSTSAPFSGPLVTVAATRMHSTVVGIEPSGWRSSDVAAHDRMDVWVTRADGYVASTATMLPCVSCGPVGHSAAIPAIASRASGTRIAARTRLERCVAGAGLTR